MHIMQENDKSGNYIKIIERFLIVGVLLFIFFDSDIIEAFRRGFRRGFMSQMTEKEIITFSEYKDQMRNILEKHKNFQQACKKIVEHKHGTVTIKEVHLSDIRIITTDGKNEVVFYKKTETYGNLEKVVVEVRTKWDGSFQKKRCNCV